MLTASCHLSHAVIWRNLITLQSYFAHFSFVTLSSTVSRKKLNCVEVSSAVASNTETTFKLFYQLKDADNDTNYSYVSIELHKLEMIRSSAERQSASYVAMEIFCYSGGEKSRKAFRRPRLRRFSHRTTALIFRFHLLNAFVQ